MVALFFGISLKQVFTKLALKIGCASESPIGLVKTHIAGPHVRGVDPIICISPKFPEDADAAGLGTIFG